MLAGALIACVAGLCVATTYYYVSFARLIDQRLHGERDRVLPRVLARPLEIRRGQAMSNRQLIDRLNELGYAERGALEKPGEFILGEGSVSILPRGATTRAEIVRVGFDRRPAGGKTARRPVRVSDHVVRLERGPRETDRLTLDAPVLASISPGEREKRRPVALAAIQPRMVQAVLSIEDRRFYEHPGIDPIGMGGAALSYATGRRSRMAGGSTITQQLVRNVFLPKFDGMTLESARERSGAARCSRSSSRSS